MKYKNNNLNTLSIEKMTLDELIEISFFIEYTIWSLHPNETIEGEWKNKDRKECLGYLERIGADITLSTDELYERYGNFFYDVHDEVEVIQERIREKRRKRNTRGVPNKRKGK